MVTKGMVHIKQVSGYILCMPFSVLFATPI